MSTAAVDDDAVALLEEVVAHHVSVLRSFHPRDAMNMSSVLQSTSLDTSPCSQRSRSSKVGRINRLMLAYLQASDEETESIREALTSACTDLHQKLARESSEHQLQRLPSELDYIYKLLKRKVALRRTKREYESLGFPPDEITKVIAEWDDANHRDIADQNTLLCRVR